MENTIIYALHGFLGIPSDWNDWLNNHKYHTNFHGLCNNTRLQLNRDRDRDFSHFIAINLWSHPILNSSHSLEQWTDFFLDEVRKKKKQGFNIEVWGYSLGGRLALSAAIQEQNLFSHIVILSSNPGIEHENDRLDRLKHDFLWAERFLTEDWNLLMTEWNNQPLFQIKNKEGILIPSPVRYEKDYNRLRLSQALNYWSIGRQKNLWPLLETLTVPITWHVGERDTKYLSIAKRIASLLPHLNLIIHPNLAHRLLNPCGTKKLSHEI